MTQSGISQQDTVLTGRHNSFNPKTMSKTHTHTHTHDRVNRSWVYNRKYILILYIFMVSYKPLAWYNCHSRLGNINKYSYKSFIQLYKSATGNWGMLSSGDKRKFVQTQSVNWHNIFCSEWMYVSTSGSHNSHATWQANEALAFKLNVALRPQRP